MQIANILLKEIKRSTLDNPAGTTMQLSTTLYTLLFTMKWLAIKETTS